MKRFLIIGFMIILAIHNLNAARDITNYDIARWYLDSDLVMICSAYEIDTLFISHYDSLRHDGTRLTYDLIKEIYHIDSDSIIKSAVGQTGLIDSIYSQDFSIRYAKTKKSESIVYQVDNSGDTIGVDSLMIITMLGPNFSDNSYFRLKKGEKHLVILSLTEKGYVIDYESECNESILNLICEVRSRGESYFPVFPDSK